MKSIFLAFVLLVTTVSALPISVQAAGVRIDPDGAP